jgi:hypothetical protein
LNRVHLEQSEASTASPREHFDRIIRLHTIASLRALHEEIRRALAEEDALPAGNPKPYGVRDFADFRAEVEAIEVELRRRNEAFRPIEWARE